MLVFLVDKMDRDELKQLSLHMYDSNHGHINLPLVGGIPETLLAINSLPATAPIDITDAFSLTTTGLSDVSKLAGLELSQYNAQKNVMFRVLEASFTSKVQALLNIDPMKRFYYSIETDAGVLLTQMSGVVNNLPFGFTGDTQLAPGSVTNVRMPYVLPAALLTASATIYGDTQTGSFSLPVQAGSPYATASVGKIKLRP